MTSVSRLTRVFTPGRAALSWRLVRASAPSSCEKFDGTLFTCQPMPTTPKRAAAAASDALSKPLALPAK